MAASQQTRRNVAGSDAHPPIASREAGSAVNRESGTAGPATEPHYAHCLPLEGGGELRICAVHGRIEVLARLGKGRVFQTTPLSAERGDMLARRITEISALARAQRQAKGA